MKIPLYLPEICSPRNVGTRFSCLRGIKCGYVSRKFNQVRSLLGPENGSYWPQWLVVLTICLCSMSVGMNLGWTSPYITDLTAGDYFVNLTTSEASYIAIVGPAGYILGAPLSGYLVDNIGRKFSLLMIAIPQLIAWLMMGSADSLAWFCVGKVIAGVADVSVIMIIPMYIGEIAHPNIRSFLATAYTVTLNFGTFLMNVVGSFMDVSQGSYVCVTLPVLFLLLFFWIPDSPYYYVMKNKMQKAEESLRQLRQMGNVQEELNQIYHEVIEEKSEQERGQFRELFLQPENRKSLFILIGLRIIQQFSGETAFTLYGQKIFMNVGSSLSPSSSTMIFTAFLIFVNMFGTLLIGRIGRKSVILGSCIGTSITLCALTIYFTVHEFHGVSLSWFPLTGMIAYVITHSIGLSIIPNVLMTEMMGLSVKSSALFVISLSVGIISSASTKLFQSLADGFGLYAPFMMYSMCTFAGAVFTYRFVPESKGGKIAGANKDVRDEIGEVKGLAMKKLNECDVVTHF